ncbi:LINE-1 retrotransposable element ORF2 protein [Stylophora pistillata]|uniref:LINE-1 retrotransposable element ORF2 protein n=1 Tax=Stylophora pistillata TaxID=50429 RepID=A0A2B4S1X4_STYPI|nr:LINE-1 retrotransposable element ORF2 protein [Stylophora pistillata]
MGNIRKMYEKIRVAIGPTAKKLVPLRSATGEQLTDKKKQIERWVERYSNLYSKERHVDGQLREIIPQLPEMTELDIPPTEEELAIAIEELASRKAPGNDNIPAEVVKENKAFLLPYLHKLLMTCWLEAEIPQDMRDAKITILYKNKGDKGDCNNYRGISLLSITGKAFARIILKRLQKLAMTSILCMRRLRWLRHVKRMDDSRIPKQLLYGELSQGKRQRGRPKLRYKDACKTSLSKCEIDVKTKDEIAVDRTKWRATVKELLCSKIASGTTRLRNVSDERKTTAVQNAAASPWYANTVAEAVVPRSEESAMKEAASKGLSRAYHEMTLLSLTDRLKRRKGPYNTRVNSTFYAY